MCETVSQAIAAWNQRAMDENVDAELTALRNRVEEWPACYSCDFHKQHENTILGTIDDCLSGQDVDVAEVMQGENCPHWQNEKREDGLLRLQHRLIEKEAELASLRQEKNEAIGAALAVEQKCYDQAQELAALRKLREACDALADDDGVSWLWHEQGPKMAGKAQALWEGWYRALAACDEAMKGDSDV